jgi:hypothetical protein
VVRSVNRLELPAEFHCGRVILFAGDLKGALGKASRPGLIITRRRRLLSDSLNMAHSSFTSIFLFVWNRVSWEIRNPDFCWVKVCSIDLQHGGR